MIRRPQSLNGVPIPYGQPIEELSQTIEGGRPEASWAAFRALAADDSPEALVLLSEYAVNSDPHVRRATIEAIGLNPNGASLAAVIQDALADESAPVVRTSCVAAAELKLLELHSRVLKLTESPDSHTQVSALRAIAVLWQPDCFEPVFRVFSARGTTDEVRKQAGFALHQNATASSWEALFEAWQSDPIPRHRTWACELAEKFGPGQHTRDLDTLSSDRDGHVRAAALRALEAARNAG